MPTPSISISPSSAAPSTHFTSSSSTPLPAHAQAGAGPSHRGSTAVDSRPSTASTSPLGVGAYAVYDTASYGSAQRGNAAEDSRPGTAASDASGRHGPAALLSPSALAAHRVHVSGVGLTPGGAWPTATDATPSTASAMSSALAVHNHRGGRNDHDRDELDEHDDDGTASGVSGLPYPLALAGRAFDGVDSEEDDVEEEVEEHIEAVEEETWLPVEQSQARSRRSAAGSASASGAYDEPTFARGSSSHAADGSLRQAPGAGGPGSALGVPYVLATASIDPEDTLRGLLASPRFARIPMPTSDGASGSLSADFDCQDVPDDVLAALASADGQGLDDVLGKAMAATVRQHAAAVVAARAGDKERTGKTGAVPAQSPPPSAGAGGSAGGQARRPQPVPLGPGALTAAPAAVPPGAAGRGFEASIRSAQNATGPRAGAAGRGQAAAQPQRMQAVDASLDVSALDALSRTLDIEAEKLLRSSLAVAAAAIASQRAALEAQQQPVLYSMAPPPRVSSGSGASGSAPGSRRVTADGSVGSAAALEPMESLEEEVDEASFDAARPPSRTGEVSVSAAAGAVAGTVAAGAGRQRRSGRPRESGGGAELSVEGTPVKDGPVAAAGVAGTSPSPASSGRRPGDGDTVLFASPSQREKSQAGAVPASVAASPYVPPSPPPGADPSPYTAASPPPSHLPPSRLQLRESEDNRVSYAPPTDRRRTTHDHEDSATTSPGTASAAPSRPWSGANNSGSRRTTQTHPAMDLSLTAAAAAAAGRPTTGVTAASTPGARNRTPSAILGPGKKDGPSQAPTPQGQPVHSVFSVAAVSPRDSDTPAAGTRLVSHDLSVDDNGRDHGRSVVTGVVSPREGAGVASLAGAVASTGANVSGRTASQAGAVNGSSSSAAGGGPPLAAIARAAALAAAADVGMAAPPPPASERQSRQSVGHSGSVGGSLAAPLVGQSPAPPSVASSSAKLSQLKARRQQQWQQSVHGVQPGNGAEPPASTHATPAPVPRPHHPPPAPQPLYDSRSYPAGQDLGFNSLAPPAPSDSVAVPNTAAVRMAQQPSAIVSAAAAAPGVAPGPQSPGPRSPQPLLPEAVAEAVNLAKSGELHLGHGISGLSVAIEEGAVRWAWQTGAGGKDGAAQAAPVSPGGTASPWTSPGPAAGVSGSGARPGESGGSKDWPQLPAPQWQRAGPAASPDAGPQPGASQQGTSGSGEQQQRRRTQRPLYRPDESEQQPPLQAALPPRRHSDFTGAAPVGDSQAAAIAAQAQYAGLQRGRDSASVGGVGDSSAGGDQHGAGMGEGTLGGSKAAALMRLKRQSIARHAVLSSNAREPEPQAGPQPLEQQHSEQQSARHSVRSSQHRSSRASSAPAHRQPQPTAAPPGAPRVAYVPGHGRSPGGPQGASNAWEPVREEDEYVDEGDGQDQGPAPKPFLKRRSTKIQARKVDWSHVKPRTNSRNPDYYTGGSPKGGYDGGYANAYAAAYGGGHRARSPLSSPRGGVTKPPLNVNVGGRAWKPGGVSPTEDAKAAAISASARRRMSNIPAAPSYGGAYAAAGAGRGYHGGPAPGSAARGLGAGDGAGSLSPLDDLLAHVNTLLKDFDKMVVK
ncbi:hypothetical protein HYH03_002157 [Edaphochlamys debaryana]|uniref:Uncharacterized protein n=1 Tax=Edaphochlamys debaryana TaxID=47281 RepID=A0A835YFC4_9CHLO|nr:hypothetical protein HYH03_002157 [Edaphochlamys debaryana]|eukprot:KAG2499866.1 hypothetical protein HYH03_002157 [Edaphochlamys debaryana]